MSELRWFLWVFMVLATIDWMADLDVARGFSVTEGLRAPFWHRIACAAVKAMLVVWAFRLACAAV